MEPCVVGKRITVEWNRLLLGSWCRLVLGSDPGRHIWVPSASCQREGQGGREANGRALVHTKLISRSHLSSHSTSLNCSYISVWGRWKNSHQRGEAPQCILLALFWPFNCGEGVVPSVWGICKAFVQCGSIFHNSRCHTCLLLFRSRHSLCEWLAEPNTQ